MRVNSKPILEKLGYKYLTIFDDGIEPEVVDIKFSDILLQFLENPVGHAGIVCRSRLYRHQWETLKALKDNHNVILISGTGSGKTEAWLLYTLKNQVPTLALYPTLALANDQIRRIRDYAKAAGFEVAIIDARRRDELVRKYRSVSRVRQELASTLITVTNPAFLMLDLKRWAVKPRGAFLSRFLERAKLIVIDEFDFYGPREIALLLSMLRLLRKLVNANFQVTVLTATLGNPEELASILDEITGRETEWIGGKPFKVPNHTYLILGKNLKEVWERLRELKDAFYESNVGEDVKKALEDFDTFRENLYKVIAVAESLGLEVPKPYINPVEIFKEYLADDGLTLVFTRSIIKAEELARKLRAELSEEAKALVATHHHLVSKAVREDVEHKARMGEIKIIFTPRTLSQGIDIGTVVRIVHYGLPDNVREFHQREGRKGRRKEIEFTESVVLPISRWDRELLSRGIEAFNQWIHLPLEKVIVKRNNKYSMLFEALYKAVSPSLSRELTREEIELLEKLGMMQKGELTRRGKQAWQKMNFYEFSPPFGIKRIKIEAGREKYLEDIGFCDLVEKFQPGSFDYVEDAVVTAHKLGGRTGRIVRAVIEEPLRLSTLLSNDALAYAYEEYEKTKRSWREQPNIFLDYLVGRLHSEVICVVKVPYGGFGPYLKLPNRTIWILQRERGRPIVTDGRTLLIRDRKVITLITSTHGKYDDYTYGYAYELDPAEDLKLARIGLAYLMLILRREYGIAFETIMYSLEKTGEGKLMVLHEPESAGLLESLNWLEVKRAVEKFKPQPIDEILLKIVDEDAHLELLSMGLRWDIAAKAAAKMIDYILLRDTIVLKVKDREITIPKPSRALKLAAIDSFRFPLNEEETVNLTLIDIYDGEEHKTITVTKEYYLVNEDTPLLETLGKYFDQDFKILAYGAENLVEAVQKSGLKAAAMFLAGAKNTGTMIDVKKEVVDALGVNLAPLEIVSNALGFKFETSLHDVQFEYSSSTSAIKDKPMRVWLKFTKYLREKAIKALRERTEHIYKLHLVSRSLLQKRTKS